MIDLTLCTPAGKWHFDGRLEEMSEEERAAYEALLVLSAPGEAKKPRRLREAAG